MITKLFYLFLINNIRKCNKTKRACLNDDEFIKNLTDLTYIVDVIYLDNYVQLGNYENPIKPILKSYLNGNINKKSYLINFEN